MFILEVQNTLFLFTHFEGKQRMEGFLKIPSCLRSTTICDPQESVCARNVCFLHVPQDILVRKAIAITSQELQMYYSLRKKLNNFNPASSSTSKHTTSDKWRLASKTSTNVDEKRFSGIYLGKEVEKRLIKLEDETEAVKQTFIETMEERKMLVNQIHEQFRCLGKQVMHFSLISKHPAVETGLSQILVEDSNPCIVDRYHGANINFSN